MVARGARSNGRLDLHVIKVLQGQTEGHWAVPLRTNSSNIHDGLWRLLTMAPVQDTDVIERELAPAAPPPKPVRLHGTSLALVGSAGVLVEEIGQAQVPSGAIGDQFGRSEAPYRPRGQSFVYIAHVNVLNGDSSDGPSSSGQSAANGAVRRVRVTAVTHQNEAVSRWAPTLPTDPPRSLDTGSASPDTLLLSLPSQLDASLDPVHIYASHPQPTFSGSNANFSKHNHSEAVFLDEPRDRYHPHHSAMEDPEVSLMAVQYLDLTIRSLMPP
ncbi:hypothetical protein B0H13DRAFT_1926868 [Mycena leptocephala]|nr:hypothetical protein B0H13DRAFT_1926868 [Mycena leptocephala]